MDQVLELNAKSGEVVERDRTTAEQIQFQADQAAAEQSLAEAAVKAEAEAAAQAAAIAHAKSLGFTDEMIAVMYPNLGA